MDSRLLLVKAITLLFKESLLSERIPMAETVVRDCIGLIQLPDSGVDFDRSRDVLIALRTTALWLLDMPVETRSDKDTLLQRIRLNIEGDEWLYQGIADSFAETDEDKLKRSCQILKKELQSFIDQQKVSEILKRYSQRLFFHPETIGNIRDFVNEVSKQLEPYTGVSQEETLEGMVDQITFDNQTDLIRLMKKGQEQTSTEGILRTGFQGLNRMLGEHGGFRRGEMVVVGALQHQFKSGFMLTLFRQMALYNTPWMLDVKKKPCLLFISLENELQQNILWLYSTIKEQETGQYCDLSVVHNMNETEKEAFYIEASQYVYEKMCVNGYHIKMMRLDPSRTTYATLFDIVTQLESNNYEIHAMFVDYLNMASKRGCDQGPAGTDIRDLFRRVRNFTSPRNITFITPAQLSPAAKQLVRGNVEDLVKEVANKGYYDGCSTIDQEVDLEIYIHIAKVNGRSYLTLQRGKHRKLRPTPEKDLYFVLPFHDIGNLHDDIFGKDSSLRHPGGGQIGSAEETPWFATV